MGNKFGLLWPTLVALTLFMNLTACNQKLGLRVAGKGEKILFVGNSFTFIHGGLENLVKELAASAIPPKSLRVVSRSLAGATLAIQYDVPEVHLAISEGDYDVVILQGDIPELTENTTQPFYKYARLFDEEIQAAGAQTLLFMTWPYERLSWVTLDEIVKAHEDMSRELQAPVAPVGLAFQKAHEQKPELDMLIDDQEHESIQGLYLAACVIYSTLFGESPVGLTYTPEGVAQEESVFLQGIAWETVQEWNHRMMNHSQL